MTGPVPTILAEHLSKTYRVKVREAGLRGASGARPARLPRGPRGR